MQLTLATPTRATAAPQTFHFHGLSVSIHQAGQHHQMRNSVAKLLCFSSGVPSLSPHSLLVSFGHMLFLMFLFYSLRPFLLHRVRRPPTTQSHGSWVVVVYLATMFCFWTGSRDSPTMDLFHKTSGPFPHVPGVEPTALSLLWSRTDCSTLAGPCTAAHSVSTLG